MNKKKRYVVVVGNGEFSVFDFSKRAWNMARRCEDRYSYHIEECSFEGVIEFYKDCLDACAEGEDIYFIDWSRGEVFLEDVKHIRAEKKRAIRR